MIEGEMQDPVVPVGMTDSGPGVLRQSPLPLHSQVRDLLVAMIERGDVGDGQRIPPERELAARFGVSLAPVRQAILDLAREGMLYRTRGKGTFVRTRTLVEHDSILASFSESMRAKGLAVKMRCLRNEKVAVDRQIAGRLQTSERRVWVLERLAHVDGEPAALLTSYLSPRRFPGLNRNLSEASSLYHVLETQFGIVPARADTTVEVSRCTTEQAAFLAIAAGSSVLLASGTTFDTEEVPVEHFHVIYRADRIRLRLETHRYVETVVSEGDQERGKARPRSPRKVGRQ